MKRILLKLIGVLGILLLVVVGVVLVRLATATVQVGRATETPAFAHAANLGSTRSLAILPLFEEEASREGLTGEHGVSYLLRLDGTTILMDVGNNLQGAAASPLLDNMRQLGVSLDEVEIVVISHNHPDHVSGLSWWQQGTFSLGSEQASLAGKQTYVPVELSYPGLEPTVAQTPRVIAEGVATLGRMPFVQPFPFWLWDPLEYEQPLAVNVAGKGLVLITGCGHPTLERIVARAETLFDQPVVGIVGGLHYENLDGDELTPHIEFLAERNPQMVALSPHDNGPQAIEAFRQAFPTAYQYIRVGQAIRFGNQPLSGTN